MLCESKDILMFSKQACQATMAELQYAQKSGDISVFFYVQTIIGNKTIMEKSLHFSYPWSEPNRMMLHCIAPPMEPGWDSIGDVDLLTAL